MSRSGKRKHSLFWDVVLTFLTGGLWLIWIFIRYCHEH